MDKMVRVMAKYNGNEAGVRAFFALRRVNRRLRDLVDRAQARSNSEADGGITKSDPRSDL